MTNSARPVDTRVGTVVADKYRIHRLLGQGGMGSVYEAENTSIGKRVALKFLHMSADQDDTTLARFHREARAISAVESAHIVQVFDWGQDGAGQPFLVMELLEGRDLAERIKQHGRLPVSEAVRFGVEALRGLAKVHAAGIVHRDLKPENLFLVMGDDELLHVKIVDFGLSKLMEPEGRVSGPGFTDSARLTQQGTIIGTPLYMSPEQVEALDVDHRTDLWSMGAILFECLAGEPPFMDRSYARLVMAICQRDPPDLCKLNPEVPAVLAAAIRRALYRERNERYQAARDFGAALATAWPEARAAYQTTVPAPSGASAALPDAPRVQGTLPSAALSAPVAPLGPGAPTPRPRPESPQPSAPGSGGPLDATIAAQTRGAATVWLADAPAFSVWRGEVDSPDRLRIEASDGSVRDLRLEPVGKLNLGRVERMGDEVNQLVYPDVASRLAATLRHDGVRWWLRRRDECNVPVQVGTRALQRGEEAPMVHGTVVTVGAMHATFVDRRYVQRIVPAGTVDPASGMLARGGLEQEVATVLQQRERHGLALLQLAPDQQKGDNPVSVRVAAAVHRSAPSSVVAREGDTVVLIVRGDEPVQQSTAAAALETARAAGATVLATGYWLLEGEATHAGSEVELALNAIIAAAGPLGRGRGTIVPLRASQPDVRMSIAQDVLTAAKNPKQQMLLFAIEDQNALLQIGASVVSALEQELAAVIATQVGPQALVTRLAPGVVGACVPRKIVASELGVAVQCEWHARPPITDGQVELPRTLSWEEAFTGQAMERAQELSRECGDQHGVLSALSGGLPHPIAGRVHAAISASSAVERVKMLFDVLEGTWRLIAVVLASAYFATARETDDHKAIRLFHERTKTREGLPLGSWRELARIAAKGFEGASDPIGQLAKDLLDVRLTQNQTFDTLSNLMHNERNSFAHGHYTEARAEADLREFEQMTRIILRALRPLAAWTLVSVQRTEPDLYGELQTVEFVDHTGPYSTGARRRIGFNSPVRLANVVYLARWRDGLVLPLEPFVRRLVSGDNYGLYWMDHLPRAGSCNMSAVVSGDTLTTTVDPRRLPPLLRSLVTS
ncbi:MAG: protein kinase [Polyangiaceae bacterium]|nr:protein kinase [Polyangiaceae bacterium]